VHASSGRSMPPPLSKSAIHDGHEWHLVKVGFRPFVALSYQSSSTPTVLCNIAKGCRALASASLVLCHHDREAKPAPPPHTTPTSSVCHKPRRAQSVSPAPKRTITSHNQVPIMPVILLASYFACESRACHAPVAFVHPVGSTVWRAARPGVTEKA
jgi:hypothetical protein